jgi:hypothetical protein
MDAKGAPTMTNQNPEILFVANREIRFVTKLWAHPRDENGSFIPLLPEGAWEGDSGFTREMCMPDVTGEAWIQAYETVTEGTPISPTFPNTPDGRLALINYCARNCFTFGRHKADAEAWAAILFGSAAVATDGRVVGNS